MSTFKARKTSVKFGVSYKTLLATSALTAAGVLAMGASPAKADGSWANLSATNGNFTTDAANPNVTNINVTSGRATAVGNADIYLNDTVNVRADLFAVRDNRNDATQILGNLNSNGRIIIIDGNGVFFGADSKVDVAGLIATTGDIADDQMMNNNFGEYQIENATTGAIENNGMINVGQAGLAAFVAPTVVNNGVINAKMGTVALAAGEKATLDMYGDGLFEVEVDGKLADALIENKGTIAAEGGRVQMSALAAKGAVDNIINVEGVVTVASATQAGGKIVLSGGDAGVVNVAGKLDASGTKGGDVKVTGKNILVAEAADIKADGGKGSDGTGNGGDVYVYADNAAIFRGNISARGGEEGGNGGDAEVSGKNYVGFEGLADLRAPRGLNGTLLIDPTRVDIVAGNGAQDAQIVDGIFTEATLSTTTIGWNKIVSQLGLGNFTITTAGSGSQSDPDITITASRTYSSANSLTLLAHDNIDIQANVDVVNTGAGNITLLAGWDGSNTTTPGFNGGPTYGANDINFNSGASVVTGGTLTLRAEDSLIMGTDTLARGATVNIETDQIDLNTVSSSVNATAGAVTINRVTDGVVTLGSGAPAASATNMQITQAEAARITAQNLVIGSNGVNKITGIGVAGLNSQANITGAVTLNAGSNAVVGVVNANSNNVEFAGSNAFNGLNVNANDSIIIGGAVTSNGAVNLAADTNAENVGLLQIQNGASLVTSDDNVTYTGNEVFIAGTGYIDATGGDITLNNKGIFASQNANSLRTSGNGIISLTVWDANIGATIGSIQNAINALQNTNTALNSNILTLKSHAGNAGVSAGDGIFNENLDINQANVKIDGFDSVPGGTPEITIKGNGASPVITVSSSNFNLDPVIIDASGAAYGVSATGAGFTGFISDGNTYKNSTVAGILLNGTTGTATVTGNTFEGSATRGVEISGLTGGLALINNNNMGVVGGNVTNGVWASNAITGGTIGIGGNTINATGAGVLFGGNVSAATVNITATNNITGYDGVEFSGDVTGATINISGGNTIIGNGSANDGDGIDFRRTVTNSTVNINGNTLIRGADDGIQVIGGISGGTFRIGLPGDGSVITGLNGDGINLLSLASSGFSGNAISNGAQVTIEGNTITGSGPETDSDNGDGTNADGVLVSGNITGAASSLLITGNTITGYDNGIHVFGNVNDATVRVNSNTNIDANDHGIFFDGAINGANVEIDGNTRIFAEVDGIRFGGPITGDADIDVTDNGDIEAWSDGISFRGTVGDTASIVIARNDIDADSGGAVGNGIAFYNTVSGQSTIDIDGNTIVADEDGIVFLAQTSNAIIPVAVQDEIQIRNNTITGKKSGVRVAQNVDADRHDIRISGNSILGQTVNGITFDGQIGGLESQIWILDNTSIIGQVDGIHFNQGISDNATLEISDNDFIQGVTDDGINIIGNVKASDVLINNNHQITAATDGIDFNGLIHDGANVEIIGNNAGIAADDHGIYFNADISEGSVVTINDNIIQANLDNAIIGSGIFFNGTVTNATVTIGDGDGATEDGNPSNIITVNANTTIGGGDINNLDGIHFNKEVGTNAVINIDGNRIGYTGTPNSGPANPAAVVADDGIEFRGNITGNADINVTDNHIRSQDDGIVFFGTVGNTANILIGGSGDGNTIDAEDSTSNGNGVVFEKLVDGQALIEISYNNINADQDGVLFQGETRNALLPGGASQQEIFINENTITGGNNGIRFAQNVATDLHDIRITGNTIDGQNVHGISFDGNIGAESQVWILNNDSIVGDDDGIHVQGTVSSSALVEIVDNTWIEGEDDDAIDFVGNISGNAVVRINSNDDIRADDNADNGIEFAGVGGSATVEILGNNHGIHADGHGIYFGGVVGNQSDIDIHDNIINADDNNNGSGDGIHFASDIENQATINIGDGNGATFGSDPSNIISGHDGIHFAGNLENQVQIVIDGNRLGFDGTTLAGPYFNNRLGDDGIQVEGELRNLASFIVTDNHIRAEDDAVSFLDNLENEAYVLIGGINDKNTIDAQGDGVQFEGNILNSSLVNISYNEIDADEDGIVFDGDTSNADGIFPFRDDEILISHNDIVGGDNGIAFYGRASGSRHDIRIEDNTRIIGQTEHGILHVGGVDAAELWILDNDEIYGRDEGIEINGNFFNGAHIEIADNSDVDSGFGAGITLTDFGGSGGADLNIINNHVHWTGDDGIQVENIDGTYIYNNTVHNTGGDGIQVTNSDFVTIDDNTIYQAGDDGIDLQDSFDSEITDNDVSFVDNNGIEINDSSFITVDNNDVTDADDAGIFIDPSHHIYVTNNRVARNDIGLYVQGGNNGYIEVTGNTFTNNEVGARFESGIIDLTNVSSDPAFGGFGNKFLGGVHGMVFDAWNGIPQQLSLVRTGGMVNGYTYDGNANDTWPATSTPVNFGGTIGEQYFEGQSTSFVTLRRNTFNDLKNPDEAIWLDASDSTYYRPGFGAFSPADTADILTQDQLDFLEGMFRHRPDATRRGIFWFGALALDVQNLGLENVEDFFKDFDPFNNNISGLNLIITGLPRVTGFGLNLNNITPFAGGPSSAEGVAGLEPAAGGDETQTAAIAQQPQDIEPAAGGEDAACWGQVLNAAVNGAVSYNFSTSPEEAIADTEACGGAL
jgi:parallel beta-helix repeat protein